MSWQTLVAGDLELRPGLSAEDIEVILNDFMEVLETDLEWNQDDEYRFDHLNWSSHVTEDKVKGCYQKHKRSIRRISLSLWYLTESDFSLHVDERTKELVFGRRPVLTAKMMQPALEYLFSTLLPTSGTSKEVPS